MPLLKHDSQPRWKYYISCHFVAVSSWLILKSNYEEIDRKYRIDFWIGIGTATWLIAIFSTVLGFYAADFLSKDMMIGLAIVNPIYFMCAMIGVMKTIQLSSAIILGAFLGPIFYFFSPEWSVLFGGLVAGSIAYFIGEKMTANIVLAILVTSLATYISRFLGALTSEKIGETSKIYKWFNCVAYSTLAALISRMLIFPIWRSFRCTLYFKDNCHFIININFLCH